MKRLFLLILCVFVFVGIAGAQNQTQPQLGQPDATVIGADATQQTLSEIVVDSFEREGAWTAKISPDNGIITVMLRDGSAAGIVPVEPVDGEPQPEDTKVLGIKVEFFRRGVNSFYINALRPIPIEGEVKTVSIWVAGRSQPHTLFLIVQDYYGSKYELRVGTLDFTGWNQMTIAIPTADGERGIVQSSAFYGDKPGLRIVGFKVDCDPQYTRGAYYLYFDDLRAITDLYMIQNRDTSDMRDDW
ncbi:MAG: flagellar filament outer layer protein FlaA [Treponema sp.]|jgi:hypothetical protein|nr:flagellar filament outer layer protein FlaA [Treponema sp.]